ncbi:SAM-dependent methyltransferase [Actinophytocola algeriensis]|uniref:S-adenosyl-L-methionine-dependent methyltransferase n=1 Tax=Actinophytocola algeriensis TaxID=1768010 RepID=A0A7W7Q861_9PSEU|nr:SAM-dependent methyltransferase [Actinophytocola algeriensis]MBB4908419.1 methyltransferase (TIGR00027 family) [Actinophytocola algeriensis]MBE1475194.1 methyltransferase (TIGR00027 family) [Actinophytocola algeriensis]
MPRLDAIERTALLTAAIRAAESRRPDRLYDDPYAAAFAGDVGPELLAEVRSVTFPSGRARTLPSTPDYNAIRTRFFDEYLTAAVRDPAVEQVVIAPVGMDARAFRLPWPRRIRLFEVDRPVVLSVKDDVLGDPPCAVDRRQVGVDLRADDWTDRLLAAGYDPAAPSVWLLEGLLYYIPEPDVHRILDGVRAMTAPGSLVAADVVNGAALRLPTMRGLLDVFAGWGCPWLFGTDEPEALFAAHGVAATAVQPGEPAADYGRWPDPVPPREETEVRRVFFVHGLRTGD